MCRGLWLGGHLRRGRAGSRGQPFGPKKTRSSFIWWRSNPYYNVTMVTILQCDNGVFINGEAIARGGATKTQGTAGAELEMLRAPR